VKKVEPIRRAYAVQDAQGMLLSETLDKFIRSRKLGIGGANGPNRERSCVEYRYDLQRFFDFQTVRGHKCYNEIRKEDVLAFIEHYQALPLADSSKAKVYRSVKAMMRWIEQDSECAGFAMRGWLTALPKIPKNKPKLWIPTPQQMHRFLHGFDQGFRWGLRDYVACSLMLDCGARIGELCHLTPEHIKFEANMILIPREGKTGERLVPIDHDLTAPLLRRWMRERDRFAKTPWLFTNRFGGACKPGTFDQSFADNRARIGEDKTGRITPHTVRHYFCTHYLVNGGSESVLRGIAGHMSSDTLQIYVHLANQINFFKSEHARVSPLKSLSAGLAQSCSKKKRKVV
jgi:integrase/recombinase XerD